MSVAAVVPVAPGPSSDDNRNGRALNGNGADTSSEKLNVFISYSRDDVEFAEQLEIALVAFGFTCVVDRHGISGGENWKPRLSDLIAEADTVVMVLSPASATSEICSWEVEESLRRGKRILPVICRPLASSKPPEHLTGLNYIYFYPEPKSPGSGFGAGLSALRQALTVDADWMHEHTRYLKRALEWDKGGRHPNRLLTGTDIAEAKAWAALRPKSAPGLVPIHLEFIRASEDEAAAHANEQRQQLAAMAAAQDARALALAKAEAAFKEAAEARMWRTRLLVGTIVAVSLLAGLLGLQWRRAEALAREAELARREAVAQHKMALASGAIAEKMAEQGSDVIVAMQDHIDPEDAKKVFKFFETSALSGQPRAMANLCSIYEKGSGVTKDYKQARIWCEKGVAAGNARATSHLGRLYALGHGVPPDPAKARQLYDEADARNDELAPAFIGELYERGIGVAHDYGKAREWYRRALDRGLLMDKAALDRLAAQEAWNAGRYADALNLARSVAQATEEVETRSTCKAGTKTAQALGEVSWMALFARDFEAAGTYAARAHALLPDNLPIETNRAHALMLLGQKARAREIYLAHKGKIVPDDRPTLWETVITDDFTALRKAGVSDALMDEIEKEFGTAPSAPAPAPAPALAPVPSPSP